MIGSTLSHYEITAKLGEGGMGEVYKAWDTTLQRDVAIKVLPAEMASDPDRLERFQREARSVAALNHPNIVTIYSIESVNVGETPIHFIAMELVEGKALDELISGQGLALTQLFEVFIPIADALAAAHGKDIVHRDLKPANLMLSDEGVIKVLDFGLAKHVQSDPVQEMSQLQTEVMTQEGRVVGTVPYMSPEQIEARPLDHLTDMFALGSILYEMASGRRPFHGETAAGLMSAILKDTPSPVVERRPVLPPRLDQIIQHCLEKDPTQRYQSAFELGSDLKRLRSDLESGGAKRGRYRWLAWAAAAVSLLAIGQFWIGRESEKGTGPDSGKPQITSAGDERQMIVVLPFENLGSNDDEFFAAGMTEEITSRLGAVSGLGVISRNSALRYAGDDKTTREIGSELGVGYIVAGTVRWAGGDEDENRVRITPRLIEVADDTQLWSESYDRVIDDIFEVQSEIADQVIERLGINLLEGERDSLPIQPTENAEAYTLYLKGRHFWNKRTEENIQRALEFFQQAVDLDPSYALAHVGIADVWIFRGWYGIHAPNEAFPKAKRAVEQALIFGDALPEPHTSRAHIYLEFDHDWEAARHEYERAIELNPNYPTTHHWYGGFLSAMGQHEEALAQAHKARELDPLSPIINTWVGLRHYFARNYEMSIEEYEEALELYPDFAPAHWHYGWALEQTGRYDEAIGEAQKAIDISANPLYIASLAHAHAIAGNSQEAKGLLQELDEISLENYVSPYHLAVVYGALGEIDLAFEWMERAYDEQNVWIGYLNVDPRVDPLRSDPRFATQIARARLDV